MALNYLRSNQKKILKHTMINKKKKNFEISSNKFGGSIHSDGPQLDTPPNYVAMACLNQAEKGGAQY